MNEPKNAFLGGRSKEGEQIVPASKLWNKGQILYECRRRISSKVAQQHAKEPPLAKSAAHVTCIEECAQGIRRVLGKGARKAHDDLCLVRLTQCARRREEVESK